MKANSIRITFPPINQSLALNYGGGGNCAQQVCSTAVDIDVRIGKSSRERAQINSRVGATIVIQCTKKFGTLSVELREPGFGKLIALGAVTACALSASCANYVEMALICPDALAPCGVLNFSYLKTAELIDVKTPVKRFESEVNAKLVHAGIGCDGKLLRTPAQVKIGDNNEVLVSRTAMSTRNLNMQTSNDGDDDGNVVLVLDVGNQTLPGGVADVNELVSAAVNALTEEKDVVALATADLNVAVVLVARTETGTPLVWCGEEIGVAKRIGMASSLNNEGNTMLRVEKKDNDDMVVLPAELFQTNRNDANLVRRRSSNNSVTWANPLVRIS